MARLLDALMDLVFLIGVAWTLTRSLRSMFGRAQQGYRGARNPEPPRKAEPLRGRTARDPVCGMFVSTEVSHRLVIGNKTLHFCSQECLDRYDKKAASA